MNISTIKEQLYDDEFALRLAKILIAAGQIITEFKSASLNIQHTQKSDQSPVTLADQQCDLFLCEQLKKLLKNTQIVSEESYHGNLKIHQKKQCFIDPIDGTKAFIQNSNEYSIMIGIVENSKLLWGAIYQPERQRCLIGKNAIDKNDLDKKVYSVDFTKRSVLNKNSLKSCKTIHTQQNSRQIKKQSDLHLILSKSHATPFLLKLAAQLKLKYSQHSSVGVKILMLIEQEADVYISDSQQLKLWDICGPLALLAASGGSYYTLCGNELISNAQNINYLDGICAFGPHVNIDWRNEILSKLNDTYFETLK